MNCLGFYRGLPALRSEKLEDLTDGSLSNSDFIPTWGTSLHQPTVGEGRVEEGIRCTALSSTPITPSGISRCAAAPMQLGNRMSQPDPLDFAQRNLVLCPVVKLGRSRRLMFGHLLSLLEPAVVLQVNRDAGCPPGVTSDRGEKTRRLGPLPDSRPGVVPVKSSSGHCGFKRIKAPEQGRKQGRGLVEMASRNWTAKGKQLRTWCGLRDQK
jgi:hypothetical protein